MASLRHPCIVSYIGACLQPPCLVMEYCQRGSVYGVLSAASEDPAAASILTWPRLMRFAWDASKGMLYLHTLKPPIVHRCAGCPRVPEWLGAAGSGMCKLNWRLLLVIKQV